MIPATIIGTFVVVLDRVLVDPQVAAPDGRLTSNFSVAGYAERNANVEALGCSEMVLDLAPDS
jgi:hypothetical protein